MAEEAAATLMEVAGTVLVNQGRVYQVAHSGMKLVLNAHILTQDKSSAVVNSKLGCATTLPANSLFIVRQPDPCHGGVGKLTSIETATGGGASAESVGLSSTAWVGIGAGVSALGTVVGVAASGGFSGQEGNPTPISPVSP